MDIKRESHRSCGRSTSKMWKAAIALCSLSAACCSAPSGYLRRVRLRDGCRIVGGEPVSIYQYPWQVALEFAWSPICGASVIGARWVLTAAHCVTVTYDLSIRAGTSTRGSGGTVYRVKQATDHNQYLGIGHGEDYDIAVLLIYGTFTYGRSVKPIKLGSSELAAGTKVTVTGWGLLSYDEGYADQLQAVNITIISRESCADSYDEEEITERMICAGEPEGGKDSCQGDSGGPLVEGTTQYGIVSWGYECAAPGYPGVYTNVAALRSWITEKTGV